MTCKVFIYAVLQVKRRFYHKPPFSGLDGSRTRVRNTIPCPSTSVVYYLTFPLPHDNKQPCGFSSFMIRPMAQSFANVVSHIVEAWGGTPAFIGRLLPAVQRTGRILFIGSARQAAAAAFIALGLSGLAGIGFLLAKRAAFISVCIFFATNRALFQSHGGRPLLLISRSLSCAFLAVALSTSY